MVRRLAYFIALTAATAVAQPAGTGVIAGRVIMQDSGEPVRKAIVNVNWNGTPRAWAMVQTDRAGAFRVDSLPAGQFSVTASKEGGGYGMWTEGGSRVVTLAAGEQRADLTISLVRPAVLSGTVMDKDGDPIPLVQVQLLREGYPRGVRELVPREAAHTNDRGEYRFSSVDPGKVYVAAQVMQQHGMGPVDPERPVAYPRQFHPSVTDWKRATPIAVQSGANIRGIDFRLAPAISISLRGRVVNLPQAAPGVHPHVSVEIAPADSSQGHTSYGSGVGPDGTFQISPVSPGLYLLTAHAPVGDKMLFASEKLDLQTDPGQITLRLMPPAVIKGKVTVEGVSPVPIAQLTVNLTPGNRTQSFRRPLQTKPQSDGSFVFPEVPPGIWDIGVNPIPRGGYIKSMRLGQQDVLTEEMEIGATVAAPLNIVVSSRGGRVTGKLPDNAPAAFIVLAPEDKLRHVMSFYSMAQAKPDGAFELTGITPGKYRLYAIELSRTQVDPRNPDLLGRLAPYAETLQIAEDAVVTAKPKLVSAEVYQEAIR